MKNKTKNIIIIGISLLIILGIILLNNKVVIDEDSIINNNLERSFDFSKYYSDQCQEGEIMSSWLEYPDGSIKVRKCTKPYTCPEGKEFIGHCSPLIEYDACRLSCFGDDDLIPEGS